MTKVDKEQLVSETLIKIGVPCHLKGFAMLKEAILLCLEDIAYLHNLSKVLYPKIANKFNATPNTAERNIRHAKELAWDRYEVMKPLFLDILGPVGESEHPIGNAEFIAVITEKLQLQLKKAS